MAAVAMWALAPIRHPRFAADWAPESDSIQIPDSKVHSPEILATFDTRLWTSPPRSETDATPEPPSETPPRPPKILLIGIVSPEIPDSGLHRAILYNPETDETYIADQGDQIGSVLIGRVTASTTELILDSGTVVLELDTGKLKAATG